MEKIGLSAVMEMAGFTAGINKYNEMLGGASSNTDKHANIMSKALAGIGNVLKTGVAVAAGGIAGLTAAITTAAFASVSWAEKLDSVGDVLGTTSEESAALAVAAQHIGGNVEQLASQMAFMTRGLVDAKGQLGPTGTALKDLGVSFQDANGNMLPTTTILQAVADKIGTMPDGLEKTKLMMQVFGKSGKDMSDMLGVLAEGGIAEFDQKAKDMGLSMSEDAVSGAIEFNRSLNDLKMMFQGFLVQIGTKAMPILSSVVGFFKDMGGRVLPLVARALEPVIKVFSAVFDAIDYGIQSLMMGEGAGGVFGGFAEGLQNIIPENFAQGLRNIGERIDVLIGQIRDILLPVFKQVADFVVQQVVPTFVQLWVEIQDHLLPMIADFLPPVLKALADIFSKVLMPVITAQWKFMREVLLPALGDLFVWLHENIPIAIQKATDFWKTTLYPALQDVWAFIKEKVIPIISDVVSWLAEHIPPAIQTAVTWFKEHILPALSDVWAFVKDTLLPKLGEIITWLAVHIVGAIKTFIETDWPKITAAFTTVKNFITNDLLPKFGEIKTWLEETIKGAIETFTKIWGGITTAFDVVKTAITGKDGLIDIFNQVVDFLKTGWKEGVEKVEEMWGRIKDAIDLVITPIKWIIDNAGKAIELLEKVIGGGGEGGEGGYNPNPGGGGKGRTGTRFGAGGEGGEPGGTPFGGWQLSPASSTVINAGKVATVNQYITINGAMDMALFKAQVLSWVQEAMS